MKRIIIKTGVALLVALPASMGTTATTAFAQDAPAGMTSQAVRVENNGGQRQHLELRDHNVFLRRVFEPREDRGVLRRIFEPREDRGVLRRIFEPREDNLVHRLHFEFRDHNGVHR